MAVMDTYYITFYQGTTDFLWVFRKVIYLAQKLGSDKVYAFDIVFKDFVYAPRLFSDDSFIYSTELLQVLKRFTTTRCPTK